MRSLFLLTIIILFSGCAQTRPQRINYDEELADECLKKADDHLKKERGLYLCGTGGGMMNQIRMLALSFNYHKPVDIDEGRELLIAAVNELAHIVNADERIHSYLKNYPFGPKDIEIRIFLQNQDYSSFGQDKLSVISALQGTLSYKIDNPKTKLFKTIHQETYEEALLELSTQGLKKSG
jgi:hypothetical protein